MSSPKYEPESSVISTCGLRSLDASVICTAYDANSAHMWVPVLSKEIWRCSAIGYVDDEYC